MLGHGIRAVARAAAVIALLVPLCAAAVDRLADTTITLKRSACLGTCPIYTLTLHGDGRVRFASGLEEFDRAGDYDNAAMPGIHEARVPAADVEALVKRFDAAGFWDLRDEYRAQTFDIPEYSVTLAVGNRSKTVVDFMGETVGMPEAATEIEHEIDRVAGSDRWIKGNMALLAWLDENHFDFRTPQAAVMAMNAEEHQGEEAFIVALIDRGVPLDIVATANTYLREPDPEPGLVGTALLRSAIKRGHATVFNRLVARGWLRRAGMEPMAQVFARHAAGCSPALVDAAAKAGLPIDALTIDEPSQAGNAGETARSNLRKSWMCEDEAARKATEESLLAHGADPHRGPTFR